MELIRGLHNLRARHHGCVVSIGNFDGFHRGHQALVAHLHEHARALRLPAVVQVFEPTPKEFFARQAPPPRIAGLRAKWRLLEQAEVDRLLVLRFDRRLAAMSAESFVDEVLVRRLGARAVVIGEDFRFGAGRAGDVVLLRHKGEAQGFAVDAVASVTENGERVSSSAVRAALAEPDLARAARLLGRPYAMVGRVRTGLQLGRRLGMPTANLVLRRHPALAFGVYAVRARINGEGPQNGVASLGVRPTLGLGGCLLETHLFHDPGNLYGCELQVEFVKYLRPERRFDSLDGLAVQMRQDRAEAETLLEHNDE